jgi:glutathione synthase/RimK-type ligase-like ATP-grasp enzyme
MPNGETYVKVFGRNPAHVTEYRVAVCGGQVIDYAQKKRRRDYEGRFNPYIRSHGNGWIFAREEVSPPEAVLHAATDAIELLDLDFGAVDIGSDRGGSVCVYEVNTAPGVEGTSLDRWGDALGLSLRPGDIQHINGGFSL